MQKNVDLFAWPHTQEEKCFSFHYPAPVHAQGYFMKGFVQRCDTAFDAMEYRGIALEYEPLAQDGEITVWVQFAPPRGEHQEDKTAERIVRLPCAAGSTHLLVGWEDFPVETARRSIWQFITGIKVAGVVLCSAHIQRAAALAVECPIQGMSVPQGSTAEYTAVVCNCAGTSAIVRAVQLYEGWEASNAEITPCQFRLEPDEERTVTVRVPLPGGIVPGGHETTRVRFVANGDALLAAELTVQTLCTLPHPYIYLDADGWRQVKGRIERQERFRPAFDEWKAVADAWEPCPTEPGRPYCYLLETETATMSTAYLYAITGERRYAEKLACFFRYFTDETQGYPARLRGCNRSYVQEGHFFQHLAIPYDIIHDAGVLTEADHAAIRKTFRLYMELLDKDIRNGHISNWVVSEATGALYCALALQDWERAMRFAFGPCGVFDQLCKGTFNDGWWHECSIGYNTWVSSMMLHAAHALRPFGVDLIHAAFPVNWSAEVSSTYACTPRQPPFAMTNQKYGANHRISLHIKDLFDAAVPFLDWRGVMFGVNDSDEKKIDGVHFGATYSLAYHYYHDPEYIPIIKSFSVADPLFEPEELPDYTPASIHQNAASDNIGLLLLRSQTEGRPVSQQIQAALHYGSHGGAHGHFDITDLLCIMRNGRSLYNPEHSWWGYRHFMYKWHVQNSLTKNMVNVDDKLQLPADSRQILFYGSKALQAAGVEVKTRWAYPPYGGMDYDDSPGDFAKRLRMNRAWFPISPELRYAELSGETEPVLQRRILAVTDDYLVLFDFLSAEGEHQYETTFQLKGFQTLDAEHLEDIGHTAQYTADPASDGQMITDCHWYAASGTSCAQFVNLFRAEDEQGLHGDRSYYNVPGTLHTDVYTAWPRQTTQVLGTCATYVGWPADQTGYNIPLRYRVELDGACHAQGQFDAWLLGKGTVDLPLAGAHTLRLITHCGDATKESGDPVRTPQGIFWGQADLTLANGQILPLASLPEQRFSRNNIDAGESFGRDYHGGRVTIQGEEYPDAIPANTIDHAEDGWIEVDLTGLNAVRFTGCIGADVFPGSEAQRRRFYAARAPRARQARFLTVLEPYEANRMVCSVHADSPDCVTVILADGRTQKLELAGLEDAETDPRLTLTEYRDGQLLRTETAQN